MNDNQLLIETVKKANFVESLCDTIRLVDPVHKRVLAYLKSDAAAVPSSHECFGLWNKSSICENCISMRSFNQKRTMVKIEYTNNRIYMVTAVPVAGKGDNPAIVELVKNITDDGILNIEGLGPSDIGKLVNRRNQSIIRDALTSVYNEQYIFERLPWDIIEGAQKGTKLALFLIKLSGLETGLKSGEDQKLETVIKEVAGVVNEIRHKKADWASHYHKNEFVLVMHAVDENKAKRISQKISAKISQLKFGVGNKTMAVQVKIGYHIVSGRDVTPQRVIEAASGAMVSPGALISERKSGSQFDEVFSQYGLTGRESETLLWLAKGNSNQEIAEKMFVGLSTVKKHVSAIFAKSGLKSRAGLIARLSAGKPE